ncbi:MAG TPA: endonuclease III domain-containing protein [Methylomirabilota bacterium]|jgi:endonuclease-3 related protein
MTPGILSGRPVLRARRTIPGPPHDPVKARLLRLHRDLLRTYGPQRWWPGRSAFEIAAGAILTQHTAWTNAARAVAALRARGLLRPARLAAVGELDLAGVIRAAGTYRLKARRLRAFTEWLLGRFGGRFDGLRRAPLGALRRELLTVDGLGPETVDAILLYAAHRPVFVADAYTRRFLAAQRLLSPTAGYEDARAFLESHLPSDPALFNEFHALVVAAGKQGRRRVTGARSRGGSSPGARRRRERRASGRARPSP